MVDEALMTGEGFPVRKVALPQKPGSYHQDQHASHTIKAGTVVLRTMHPVPNLPTIGIVVSTGFGTSKGRLLRRIIHPIKLKRTFYHDALYFIAFMGLISLAMFGFSVAVFLKYGPFSPPTSQPLCCTPQHAFFCLSVCVSAPMVTVACGWARGLLRPGVEIRLCHVAAGSYGATWSDISWKLLDMITIAVPPALPACLTIASSLSIMRLKQKNIHTIDVDRISVAGAVETLVFDKTGTLTQSSLQLESLWLVEPASGEATSAFDLWLCQHDSNQSDMSDR